VGGAVSWVTHRALSAVDLLALLLSRGVCDRCLVSTFNVSPAAASLLGWALATERVLLLDAVVSEAMVCIQEDGGWASLVQIARLHSGRVRVRAADVHANIYCLAMAEGDNWVVETSANLARNSRVELYTVHNSAARLAWHASWIGGFLR
jgi:hypothetical protein